MLGPREQTATGPPRQPEGAASSEQETIDWRQLFDRALDPVFIYHVSEDGQPLPYLDVNDAALALYGYSREEMLRMSSLDLIDPESMDVSRALDALREHPDLMVRSLHIAKDGRRIPVEAHAHLFEFAGRPTVLAICRDLTERQEAEAAVREQERRLAEALESINDSFVALDHDGRITHLNRLAAEAVGREPEELIGKVIFDEYPGYRGTEIERAVRQAAASGEPVLVETYSPVTDRWVEASFYPTPEGLSGFGRDISKRKRAEEVLARTASRLRNLADAALTITQATSFERKLQVITDEARRVVHAHQAVTSITQEGDHSQSINAVSLSEKYAAYRGYDRQPDGSGIYAEVSRTNRPIRLTQAELEAHPAFRNFGEHAAEHPPIRGWMAAPLIGQGGQNLGLIQVSDKEDGEFTENDEAVLVQFAQFASSAIETARAKREQLRDAERFRVIVSQALVGVAQTDLTGRFTYVNERFCVIVGYTPEELIGRSMQELTHPDDLPRNLPQFYEAAGGGAPFVIEKRYVRKDGSDVWVNNTVRSLLDPEGRPFAILAVVLDVTERRRQDQALRESETRLRLAVEAAELGTWELDLTSQEAERSLRHDEIFGYDEPVPEWTFERFIEHVLPEDRGHVEAAFEEAAATGGDWNFTCRIRRPDGEIRWIEAFSSPAPPSKDSPPRLFGTVEDVTERVAQEQALRESEARFRTMSDAAPVLIWLADPTKDCIWFNRRWLEFTGRSMEQEYGSGWAEGVHPDDLDYCLGVYTGAFDRREPFRMEYRLRRHDGAYRWLLDEATPLSAPDGTFTGYIGACIDIHDRKEAKAQLEELNATLERRVSERTALAEDQARQIRQLAAEVTRAEQQERRRLATTLHDHLQQLLTAAQFHLQLASGEAAAEGPLRKVGDLLGESLSVSRSLTVQLSPPVLHDGGLVPALGWLARWMEEHHGLQVRLDADAAAEPEDEHVRIVLFEAAREVLFNVVKHAGVREASVRLETGKNETVHLRVQDKGVGFSPTSPLPSTAPWPGLGLPTLRERMGYIGGRFELHSQPGQGTLVTIVAPRTAAPLHPAQPYRAAASGASGSPSALPSDGRPLRVLLVDDHHILRAGLHSLLDAEEGLEVVGEAADGVEAVDLALTLRPDVIVMDITMPRMNGIEATRKITAVLPDVRVIGLSMHSQADMAEALREAGAATYIAKGGPPKALVEAIRNAA